MGGQEARETVVSCTIFGRLAGSLNGLSLVMSDAPNSREKQSLVSDFMSLKSTLPENQKVPDVTVGQLCSLQAMGRPFCLSFLIQAKLTQVLASRCY